MKKNSIENPIHQHVIHPQQHYTKEEKINTKHTIDKYTISCRNVLLRLFFDEQNICVSIQTNIIPTPSTRIKRET